MTSVPQMCTAQSGRNTPLRAKIVRQTGLITAI
jgi:hypothetical protein